MNQSKLIKTFFKKGKVCFSEIIGRNYNIIDYSFF